MIKWGHRLKAKLFFLYFVTLLKALENVHSCHNINIISYLTRENSDSKVWRPRICRIVKINCNDRDELQNGAKRTECSQSPTMDALYRIIQVLFIVGVKLSFTNLIVTWHY